MGAVGWRAQALCAREGETNVFFDPRLEDEAKAICARCPVQEECLDHALTTREYEGVWGGLNVWERLRAAIAGGALLDVVVYTTQARSTGATCSAGRTPDGWGAACLSHGTATSAQNRTVAERAVSHPQEWCPGCSLIVAGEVPKINR